MGSIAPQTFSCSRLADVASGLAYLGYWTFEGVGECGPRRAATLFIAKPLGRAMAGPRWPVVLVVIDGWGIAPPGPHNAIELAGPRNMRRLAAGFPATELDASGPAVGLPEGQMGNSEVGHLNIGAGRVVEQDFVRISRACRRGDLPRNPVLSETYEYCRTSGAALHLLGLLGPGGVHSHWEHLYAHAAAAKVAAVPRVFAHHVLDGRDTPPRSALDYARAAQPKVDATGLARVATVVGRYWMMDRDKRWDRTARAYRMLTALEGHRAPSAAAAIEAAYARDESDEFVAPTVLDGADPFRVGDAVVCYNFRPDRMRQIVRALVDPAFREFPAQRLGLRVVTATQYDKTFSDLGVRIAFPPQHPERTLGEVYSRLGLRQLRIAETEKYAHVTYFFSGGREEPFAGEERILVPSPKVATYDLKAEMSAHEITDALLDRLRGPPLDLVVLNFANPDMVGHTGMLEPTVRAVQTTDACIGRIAAHCRKKQVLLAVTADHGNAEKMVDDAARPQTAHTTNRVPFLLVHESLRGRSLVPGGLASVAPTLLETVGLAAPAEMTAPSLLVPVTKKEEPTGRASKRIPS